jgi:uncharacterized surface protein with fasciclin (FAS1) repeats/nucleoid-associated protein YgaU
MWKTNLRQVLAAWVIVAMLLSSTASFGVQVARAQMLRTQAVAGVLTGGQFAKIWLGLVPETKGQSLTITTEWDRANPESNGLGFFLLDQEGLNSVLNGSATVRDANLSAGSKLSPQSPDNQLGAVIQATGDSYTIVLFNDSSSDANFTVTVTNGFILDDSNQVRDLNAQPTPATTAEGDETPAAEATEEPAADATEEPAATPAPVATATATPTATVASTTTVTAAPAADTPAGTPGVVRAQELRGELPEVNDQHYFALEPSERDGAITITYSFDPQDSSELARRTNFWVLTADDFRRFTDASVNVILSEVAIAAGSQAPGLQANQRQAKFTASGFGPYVVIVYNNANVPATYTLRVDGGILVDDAGQSLNAQRPAVGAIGASADEPVVEGAATPAPATTTAAATGGREGEPGGVYVVQAGDTLSLIARDIYGDVGLWEEICAFNGLADCNTIEVGQEIRLPTQDEIAAGATAAPAAAPAATATPAATPAAAATPAVTTTTTGTVTGTVTGTATVTTTGTTTGTTTAEPEATGTPAPDEESAATVNLVAALEAAGSFSTLVEALTAAGLTDALEGAGPFTIFAPTDAAFAELPAGAVDALLQNPTGQLTQILLFHVLPGRVMSPEITNGMSATTQQGQAVSFEVAGGTIRVNGALVSAPDIEATNGVIHAIDAVILPPG